MPPGAEGPTGSNRAAPRSPRVLFGNPGVSLSDAWPMVHPVGASLIRSLLILVVLRTLAVRKY
ncbi:hypothetical protein ACFV6W_35280, partial [Streptomyces sp. NPDC059802]